MARKLAALYWNVIVNGTEFAELGIKKYEMQLLAQKKKSVERMAKELNLQLVVM
jgi:phage portal protein BeeE